MKSKKGQRVLVTISVAGLLFIPYLRAGLHFIRSLKGKQSPLLDDPMAALNTDLGDRIAELEARIQKLEDRNKR